jgi:hypothetical protein
MARNYQLDFAARIQTVRNDCFGHFARGICVLQLNKLSRGGFSFGALHHENSVVAYRFRDLRRQLGYIDDFRLDNIP